MMEGMCWEGFPGFQVDCNGAVLSLHSPLFLIM